MTYKLQITSNFHHRHFIYRYDVPKDVLEWYSWLTEDDSFDGWICYQGHWSHLSDYERLKTDRTDNFGWHGYKGDSMSSGTVIKIEDDCETYQIGWYVSVSAA
jgi:hypothetical protein